MIEPQEQQIAVLLDHRDGDDDEGDGGREVGARERDEHRRSPPGTRRRPTTRSPTAPNSWVRRGLQKLSSFCSLGSATSMRRLNLATETVRRMDEARQPGALVAEHHLDAEDQHGRADDAGDSRGHGGDAVGQAEQDQHEPEGTLAEGLDDLARSRWLSPSASSTTARRTAETLWCSGELVRLAALGGADLVRLSCCSVHRALREAGRWGQPRCTPRAPSRARAVSPRSAARSPPGAGRAAPPRRARRGRCGRRSPPRCPTGCPRPRPGSMRGAGGLLEEAADRFLLLHAENAVVVAAHARHRTCRRCRPARIR